MSQYDRLPKIKRIELTPKAMRPPEGSTAVGSTPDGHTIYEGPVFAGNPWFKDHSNPDEANDSGHVRVPVMDAEGKLKFRRNKSTGEAITQVFRNKRRTKIARFIMVDDGNGSAGPRPVPNVSAAEIAGRAKDAEMPEYSRKFIHAAMEEGIDPRDLAKTIASLAKPMQPKRGPGRPPKQADDADTAA